MKHTNTFSHAVSHHFGLTSSGNEWRLCFKDELTHLEKMGEFCLFQTVYNIMQEDLSQHGIVFSKSTSGGTWCTMCWKPIALSSKN